MGLDLQPPDDAILRMKDVGADYRAFQGHNQASDERSCLRLSEPDQAVATTDRWPAAQVKAWSKRLEDKASSRAL